MQYRWLVILVAWVCVASLVVLGGAVFYSMLILRFGMAATVFIPCLVFGRLERYHLLRLSGIGRRQYDTK